MLKKLYLLGYNLASCLGWAYVWYLGVLSLKNDPTNFWSKVGEPLTIVQSLAFMEIIHSILRIVPSPIMSTFPQVFSRLFLLWGFSKSFEKAQGHWSIYLMVLSWASVKFLDIYFMLSICL
jgi:very-long-chain (3R)-3-hydroxyacyl-CoA dehydratase